MEQFPIFDLDPAIVTQGIEIEAYGLACLAESGLFPDILARFADYPAFLSARHQDSKHRKTFDKLLEKHRHILSTHLETSLLQDAFFTAHFAACCELFHGSRIPFGLLRRDSVANWVTGEMKQHYLGSPQALHQLDTRLHSMDAVRTMQILRILGLVTRQAEAMHQLSLGAGSATKDIRSIHLQPHATITHTEGAAPSAAGMGHLSMTVAENSTGDTIITDADPQRMALYQELNQQGGLNLQAINRDTFETLRQLPGMLENAGMAPRNLVVALRIDHRMIPDVREFFSLLAGCIGDSADLVISIGSGFTLDDFIGRTRKLQELFSALEECRLSPTLIELHGPGDPETRRNTPGFGLSNITTYEILYCKLKRKRLEARYRR